jgi:hypothetical protein
MAVTYDSISTTTVSSASSSVSITGISASYTDLRIIITGGMSTAAADVYMRMNAASDNAYYTHYQYSAQSGLGYWSAQATESYIGNWPQYTGSANKRLSTIIVDIFNYTATVMPRMVMYRGGYSLWPANAITSFSGGMMYDGASVISAVSFSTSNSFAVGTSFALYGILKA